MYYINKLYELGQLSFKTTDPSIIDELLEYYIYDNNLSIDINDIKNDISIVEYMINQVNNQINLFQSFEKNKQ